MNRALKYYTETVETVQNKGIEFAQQLNDQRLGKWKEIKINIAVIGETSVGKSSFINTIRK
jgi:ribosome biogenesis GTPase A